MGNFFAELKHRQMFRVAAAYAVVAWLLLQLVNNLTPALNLPNWAATFVTVLLIVGFPIALLFCWIQQLAPGDGAQAHAKVNKIDWILVGGLAAVIALLLYQQLAPSGALIAQNKAGTEITAQTTAATGVSIAVLPFANVSGDASRDFFSDGMTDEISGTLARIRDLRVIARASAFQFKGRNQDVRAVGQALGASHLIDGSVRQAGNRVRITAQLVRANDGVQLWSENYDRELTDVFAIQEEIALAIAGAMRVPLGIQQGERLVPNRTTNLETYDQFLRARALYRSRAIDDAIALLEPAVERNRNYAPAWALLSLVYSRAPQYSPTLWSRPIEEGRRMAQSFLDRAEMAAREAIRFDPEHSGGYAGLAAVEAFRGGEFRIAEDHFRQALALDPNDADTLHQYSSMLADAGRLKDALPLRQQLRTLEPFVPVYNTTTAEVLLGSGDRQAAIRMFELVPPGIGLARAYALGGRYAEGADTLLALTQRDTIDSRSVSRSVIEDAARLLRSAPAKVRAPDTLPDLDAAHFVYIHIGASDRALEYAERFAKLNYFAGLMLTPYWLPEYAPLRKTERFKTLMRDAGLVEYWRARGWPDVCRPVGADDFVCD